MDDRLDALLDEARSRGARVLVLTGAGVSAESGIPTFRGPGGYWRVGSIEYRPEDLATFAAFSEMPDDVWAWYLYRRAVCRAAAPNPAHHAIVALERALGPDRFTLVTQNVDGLHLRAGSSRARTFEIHGNIDFMRCADDCTPARYPFPDGIAIEWPKGRALDADERSLLRCPKCGARARPHVLWFDESYDEERFALDRTLLEASRASLVIVAGTTGQTSLPIHVGAIAANRGTPMVVVNPEPNPFSALIERGAAQRGAFLIGTAGDHLPELARRVGARFAPS